MGGRRRGEVVNDRGDNEGGDDDDDGRGKFGGYRILASAGANGLVKLWTFRKEGGGGAKAKAGPTVRDGRSAARPSITGPCGTTESTTTMAVAAARRIRIWRRRNGL